MPDTIEPPADNTEQARPYRNDEPGNGTRLNPARVGDRVRVTLEGVLTSYDPDLGHWTLRGCDAASEHAIWDYTLHWGTTFVPVAAEREHS